MPFYILKITPGAGIFSRTVIKEYKTEYGLMWGIRALNKRENIFNYVVKYSEFPEIEYPASTWL